MYNYYLDLKKEKEREDKLKQEQEQKLFQLRHKSKKYSFIIN